uniref:Putative bicoid n=1 Tax=Lonchoptera lutea TaxID=92596 RepID=B4YK62_9MUSC|nr:putative bicoid [Lonchoptera lutea]
MAQPPDQNFYHHPQLQQLQLPTQFRNPFDLLFDERTGGLNYNYIRPYIPTQPVVPDVRNEAVRADPLVMRRPRRTRTTFTSAQISKLEQYFNESKYVNASRLAELSGKLNLGNAQVKIWFKNRRRRLRIEQLKLKELNGSNDTTPAVSVSKDLCLALPLTPTTLTPSPSLTPTSTPNISDQYSENYTYNPYTYNPYVQQHAYEQQVRAQPMATQYYQQPSAISQQLTRDFLTSIKTEPDFNYNSTPYMRMPAAETMVNYTKIPTKNCYLPELSPNSEVYEPLTPKTEGRGSPKMANTSDEISNTHLVDAKPEVSSDTASQIYEMTKSVPEGGYQCTMDSILQAYNQHRNTNTNNGYNTQFAFCFN